MKARYFVNKAKALEKRLHRLQSNIYDLSSELEDSSLVAESETASESGFELDVAQQKMNDLWTNLENAYCRKITKPQLYDTG